MLLTQQSRTFRVWTSRTLILYFRRILFSIIVNSDESLDDSDYCLLEKHHISYFSDVKDDEHKQIVNSLCYRNQNQNDLCSRQTNTSKRNLLKDVENQEKDSLTTESSKLSPIAQFFVEQHSDLSRSKSMLFSNAISVKPIKRISILKSMSLDHLNTYPSCHFCCDEPYYPVS